MFRLLTIAALLALCSCVSRQIVMQGPTGTTIDCGSRSEVWTWDVVSNPGREEACVRDYQLQGWRRIS